MQNVLAVFWPSFSDIYAPPRAESPAGSPSYVAARRQSDTLTVEAARARRDGQEFAPDAAVPSDGLAGRFLAAFPL